MSRFVIVVKFVITTSSLGIIIKAKNSENTRFFPGKFIRAKAYAASIVTTSMIAVVITVKISVLRKYFASGTAVKASI